MAKVDKVYLNTLVTRFKGFKSPNDTQKLIIALGSKQERNIDDDKKLAVLLKAEKTSDELVLARAATKRLLDAEKTADRKAETRKKVVWGAALKKASENDPEMAQVMRKLYNDGYVSDRDKEAVRVDFEAISDSYIA